MEINLLTILGLALVDAVNPCALAVMAIVLITLLIHDPRKRKNVLYGGLAFTLAVYITYFLYGLILVSLFSNIIPETGIITLWIFRGFGLFAILLGILNFKDFINYKPGGLATEMPLSMRPRMKKFVKKITSPFGAFIVGIFVTLFLLPCTIGPYLIASGKLSILKFLATIPYLLIYNLVFILPMIIITLMIYFSLTSIEKVSGWKERNIRYLHLIESLVLLILGILMITGIL